MFTCAGCGRGGWAREWYVAGGDCPACRLAARGFTPEQLDRLGVPMRDPKIGRVRVFWPRWRKVDGKWEMVIG